MGRIVLLHQPPGAGGDIFELKFDYDNDYENGDQTRMRNISGRILDYEIRGNWGNWIQEFIQKGGK